MCAALHSCISDAVILTPLVISSIVLYCNCSNLAHNYFDAVMAPKKSGKPRLFKMAAAARYGIRTLADKVAAARDAGDDEEDPDDESVRKFESTPLMPHNLSDHSVTVSTYSRHRVTATVLL